MRVYEILNFGPEVNRLVEPPTDMVTQWSGRYPSTPADVTHAYRNMSPEELKHVLEKGRFEPLNGQVKWWSKGDAEGVFGREFKSGAGKPQVRVPIDQVKPNKITSAVGAEIRNPQTGAWEPLKLAPKSGRLATLGRTLGTGLRWATGGPIGAALQGLAYSSDLNSDEEEALARRRGVKEDEYDQFDQPKDPSLLKVNADTYYKTSKADQIFWKPEDFKIWEDRAAKLRIRVQRIYARLQTVMPQEDKSALSGVKVIVPLTGDMSWASARYDDRIISMDLGCFWDLSDDAIAYTLGHEIGHMVWALGPKKNWEKDKKRGLTRRPAPENRRLEMDADVYGALLAYQLGYDRRKAWDNFTIAYQREPWDPRNPEYPSVGQRKQNVDRALAQKKKEQDSAQRSVQPTAPEAPQGPSPEKAEKDAWLSHIMKGLEKFDVAIAQDPNMNLA